MTGGRLLWVLLWCAGIGTTAASTPPRPQPLPLQVADSAAPTFTVYSGRDGLSDEIWSTVGFDADGFVWAGSASSLARFDGYRWQMWPLPHAHSLVRDMQADAHGTLWAIFEREGLARYDGHAWTLVGKPHFFQRFSSIGSGAGRQLWAVREDGLMYLHDGAWVHDPGNATFASMRPNAFAQTTTLFGATRQWIGSSTGGLWYRTVTPGGTPGPWQRFDRSQVNEMPVSDLRTSVNDAGQEELWVISYGGGLARIRADGIRVWRAATGELPSEALYSMAETHTAAGKRRLWIASRGGLLRIRGDDRIDVFDRRNGLPSNAVRSVKVQHGADGIDVLWLATEGGVVRAVLNDSPWQTVSLLGANFNGIFGLMLEPDGKGSERLWVGSAMQGLALLAQGKWRMFTRENGALPVDAVRGIWRVPGPDGKPHRLLSLTGAGLLEIDDTLHIVPLSPPWPVRPDESVTRALGRSYDGAVEWWISTLHSGVYRLRDGQWKAYTLDGATRPWSVLALAEQIDASGRSWLWAAGPQGLARFDGDTWQRVQGLPGLPADGYLSVTLFDDGKPPQLWASSYHNGVVRLDVSDPRKPRRLGDEGIPPPPDPTIYSVLHDSRGRVYLCTNNGVQQLTPRPQGGYSQRVFHRRDGLVHDECNTGSQLIDGSDRYWVGTLGGLSVFDPDVQQASVATRQPRPLYFTSLTVDGAKRSLPGDVPLDLPAGVRALDVEYSLLAGQRERETRYRSQLVGYESKPTDWTAEHRRSFAGLPPGHYQLRVEARDFSGTAGVPRMLAFSIAPHWWQRRSLQVLMAALAVLGALAGVMTYNRGLRARQRQLRGEVAERTLALSVANERLTELSYLDPLTGLANRRRLMEAIGTAIERARDQRLPIGLIVLDVDHFKHYNDRHGHLAGDAALLAIAKALQRATRGQDLVARFGGEEFACLLIDAELATVTRVAERMRALVETLPPRSLGNDSQVITLSAGVLSRVPRAHEGPEDMLGVADAALYRAKSGGRNRVVQATD